MHCWCDRIECAQGVVVGADLIWLYRLLRDCGDVFYSVEQ